MHLTTRQQKGKTFHSITAMQVRDEYGSNYWTCTGMKVLYQSYLYTRKHVNHWHFINENDYVVITSNVRISKSQAQSLLYKYLSGQFKLERTDEWQ